MFFKALSFSIPLNNGACDSYGHVGGEWEREDEWEREGTCVHGMERMSERVSPSG